MAFIISANQNGKKEKYHRRNTTKLQTLGMTNILVAKRCDPPVICVERIQDCFRKSTIPFSESVI